VNNLEVTAIKKKSTKSIKYTLQFFLLQLLKSSSGISLVKAVSLNRHCQGSSPGPGNPLGSTAGTHAALRRPAKGFSFLLPLLLQQLILQLRVPTASQELSQPQQCSRVCGAPQGPAAGEQLSIP